MSEYHKEQEQVPVGELLERFLRQLLRMWAVVLAIVVTCCALWTVWSRLQYRPRYQATARFSVSSSYEGNELYSVAFYDSAAAKDLAEAFPYMLEMDLMKDLMKDKLGSNTIDGTITPYSVANTNMFVLQVESSDPQKAYDILIAAVEAYPQVAMYMVENPRIDMMDQVRMQPTAINPFSWKQVVVRGAMLGLVLALGLVAVMTVLVKNVTTLRQLKALGNLSVMGTFPKLTVKKRRSKKQVLMTADADMGFAEALRGLSLKVRKHLRCGENRVIVVTSTLSGEGKTTTAANLAITLAEDGSRVVLVDGDLRNQTIGRLMECQDNRGLLACLRDESIDVMECLQKMPGRDVMYLSGSENADWKYAINPRQLRRVLERLQQEFDYVVLDTAPTALVSDTAQVCRAGGCVLYVVRADWAREDQILDHVEALHERNVDLTGFVFNGAPRNRSGYGYGYGYGSYGYGYGKTKK